MLESVSLASLILALQLPLLLAATLMLALTPACDLGHLTLVRRPYFTLGTFTCVVFSVAVI